MAEIRSMNVNRKIISLAAALLALSMVAGVHVALAQEKSPATKIAVIDTQFLMENLDAAKNLRAQIAKMRAIFQKEVKNREDKTDKLIQSIARERPKLSEDAFQQRMRGLRQKVANQESDMQERQSKLEGAFRGAPGKIEALIEQTVDEIRKEKNYALVLPRSMIIGTPAVPDISKEVLSRLNKRTPSIPIDLPK